MQAVVISLISNSKFLVIINMSGEPLVSWVCSGQFLTTKLHTNGKVLTRTRNSQVPEIMTSFLPVWKTN